MHDGAIGVAHGNCRPQCVDGKVRSHVLGNRPADDAVREHILDRTEVKLAFVCPVFGVGVGLQRRVDISVDRFLQPALRTGRATLTASGSPQIHAVVGSDAFVGIVHGLRMRVPR